MLELTLRTKFVPGTNVSGDMACADWRFLLPSLDLEEVLCLGIPPVNTVAVLSTICRQLNVLSTDHRGVAELREVARQRGLSKVQAIAVTKYEQLPFPDQAMDLIWTTAGAGSPDLTRSAGLVREVERLLRADGSVYFETHSLADRLSALHRLRRLANGSLGTPQVYWQTPQSGEMRTALAVEDRAMARHFFRHVLFGLSLKKRMLSRIGATLSALGLLRAVMLRRGILVTRARKDDDTHQPPQYLASLAEKAGMDLRRNRFGFSARGLYNSNKVVFYLFERSSKKPEAIVKMTRAPEFNFRLANEAASLSKLAQKGYVEAGTYPELLFFDTYQGHAVLAQRAIHGEPFRQRTTLRPDCPYGRNAIEWITRLGRESANRAAATPKQVAAGLMKLFAQFEEIYQLPEEELRFLREQIGRIESAQGGFPLVFQHGDPGSWNLLVRKDGRVVFLDWESGEPEGMPLWDLFYFVRSFGTWIARRKGQRDAQGSFRKNFIARSALSELLAEATKRYCAAVGLDRDLAEPLFYTCWMHRALKESARLQPGKLQGGEFVKLLRLCIRERNRPELALPFFAKSQEESRQGDAEPGETKGAREEVGAASTTPLQAEASRT